MAPSYLSDYIPQCSKINMTPPYLSDYIAQCSKINDSSLPIRLYTSM